MIATVLVAALAADPIAVPPPPDLPPPVAVEASSGAQAAVVALQQANKVCSGVLISDLGLILTTARNFNHLGDNTTATFLDGRRLTANVALVDPAHDLAVLRLPLGTPYPSVALAQALPDVGAPIQAISHTGASAWTSSSAGLTARFAVRDGKTEPLFFRVQLVNPAVSEGGAVLSSEGELLGILASESGSGSEWAVTTDAIRGLADTLGGINDFTLSVHADPPGTTVTVDGKEAGRTGPEPVVLSHLANGSHAVKLQAPNAADDLLTVTLLQHQTVSLQRHLGPGGQVELASNSRADVWIDGTARGTVPLFLTLPPGEHRLDLRASGFESKSTSLVVVEGARQAVTVELTPIVARLSVNTVPEGAEITANGAPVGHSPLVDAVVPAGPVSVGIAYPDRHSYAFKLTLSANEKRDLGTYRLEEPFGWLEPHGLPPGTQLVIDAGQRHPFQAYERVPTGDHHVEILAPSYYAFSEQVTVADAQAAVLDPPLRLYDHLSPRRATGAALLGLGACVGLVAVGFVTDPSTNKIAPATAMVSLSGLATGIYLLVTATPGDQAGWAEHASYSPSGATR